MPPSPAPALPGHQDALLEQHLHNFLGDFEPNVLALLRERLTWDEVAGGQALMEQGALGR